MQKAQKERIVRGLENRLGGAKCLYLTDFTGLDVSAITELRRQLSDASVEYVVVKNTLARRALAESPYEALAEDLTGPSAFAWSEVDVVSAAKILTEFAEEWEKPRIKAGAIEGEIVSLEEIGRIAKLPPREELLSRLVGSAQSPVTGLVRTLHGLLAQFVRTLDAVRAKVEEEAPEVDEAPPEVEEEVPEVEEEAPEVEEEAPEVEEEAPEEPTAEAEPEPAVEEEPAAEDAAADEAAPEEEAGDDRPEASSGEDEDEERPATASADAAGEADEEDDEEEEQAAPEASPEK